MAGANQPEQPVVEAHVPTGPGSPDSQNAWLPEDSSSLAQFRLYFLWLGSFGFGGPIALDGYMQRDLVEKRRWISKED